MGAVSYTLEVVDEIPARERPQSPLEDALVKIREASAAQSKPITAVIGLYKNGSACTAAANVLRQKHGTQDVEGFKFETRRVNRPIKDENGADKVDDVGNPIMEEVTALYVNYDAGKVVDGARAAWDQKMKDRVQELAAKKAERDAKTAKTGTQPEPQPNQPTSTTTPNPAAPNPATTGMTPPQNGDADKTPQAAPKAKETAQPNAKR